MGNMWAMNQEKMREGFYTPSPLISPGSLNVRTNELEQTFWWSPCCRFIHCCCVEFVVVVADVSCCYVVLRLLLLRMFHCVVSRYQDCSVLVDISCYASCYLLSILYLTLSSMHCQV